MKNQSELANQFLDRDQPVLAAVSGGADSLAMMLFLHRQGFKLVVATFDHQLRAENGKADVAYVAQLCEQHQIQCVSGSADVAEFAKVNKLSIEEAARHLRYKFLFEQARQVMAQAVVTGHTTDDQVETILMHFIRGAGLAGLKGMTASSVLEVYDPCIPLVRPILGWTRQDTEAYCLENGVHPCQDATNNDLHFFRNRVRHTILPLLKELNPNLVETIYRSSEVLQADHFLLEELTRSNFHDCLQTSSAAYYQFDLRKLSALHQGLFKRILRHAAFSLKPGLRDVDKNALDRISLEKGVQFGGGLNTFIEGDSFYITRDIKAIPAEKYPQLINESLIQVGTNALSQSWLVVMSTTVSFSNLEDPLSVSRDGNTIILDTEQITSPLIVRKPYSGDRFEPLGMSHQTVKLADLFINLKIPKRYRANYPVITHAGKVIWVPGLRRSEALKVHPQSKNVVILQLIKNPAKIRQGSR